MVVGKTVVNNEKGRDGRGESATTTILRMPTQVSESEVGKRNPEVSQEEVMGQ